MAVNLQKGQRVGLGNSMQYALVGLGWDSNRYDGGYDFDLDASAFLLGSNGKVISDEDFVFYNNLEARDGAVRSMGDDTTGGNSDGGDDEQIYIDFTKLPPEIEKIAITVTIHEADVRHQNFGQVSNAYVRVAKLDYPDAPDGETVLQFDQRYFNSTLKKNFPLKRLWLYAKYTRKTANGNSMQLRQATAAVLKHFVVHTV